jgi:ABC-2 type transport system permease protein
MRLSKAWTVSSKDFRIFTKKRYILYSIIGFELFVSIGLPLVILFVSHKPGTEALLPVLINSFSFWFVMGAALLPTAIASYSLVGEKVQKSLEPLLATPTTDEEILAGKAIAAFIPAILSNYVGAILFMVIIDVLTRNKLASLYFPNWTMAIMLLLLAPLACILSIGFNVLISSQSSDIRAAQQTGALIILPFGAIYVLSELSVIPFIYTNLLILAAALLVLDLIFLYLARAAFQREEILTEWK